MTLLPQLADPSVAPHLRRLSQRSSPYLQTLVTGFTLLRQGRGLELKLTIDEDPLTIVDGRGKRDLESLARAPGTTARERLHARINALRSDPDLMGYRVDCSQWPLRYANGGVLPIVHWEGRDHFLMFYRDIFPIGWNIANGASDDVEEWLQPERIIHREFAEEVLITDPSQQLLYVYSPPLAAGTVDFHKSALTAWTPHRPELTEYLRAPLPFKWIHGPDAVEVAWNGRTERTEGLFLNVTPDDHGLEADRFVLIRLPGEACLLCGEIADGRPLNQIVGLFSVDRMESLLSGREFRPDLLFHSGRRFDGDRLDEVLPAYLAHVRADPPPGLAPLRRQDQNEYYDAAEVRYDLCPISRAMIGRYYEWRAGGGTVESAAVEQPPSGLFPAVRPGGDAADYQVFISHASPQAGVARALYDYLQTHQPGTAVFLSGQSLRQQGESNYRRAIEQALVSARCLIVLMLAPSDLESEWVRYEWSAFHSEILSGQKQQGQIFTLRDHERLKNVDLPLGLRQHEVIAVDRAAPAAAFERLSGFLASAMAR